MTGSLVSTQVLPLETIMGYRVLLDKERARRELRKNVFPILTVGCLKVKMKA